MRCARDRVLPANGTGLTCAHGETELAGRYGIRLVRLWRIKSEKSTTGTAEKKTLGVELSKEGKPWFRAKAWFLLAH